MKKLKFIFCFLCFCFPCLTLCAQEAFNATLTFKPSSSPIKVSPWMLGLSYEKNEMSRNLFRPDNDALVTLFNRLVEGVLRIGGNNVEDSQWDPNGPGSTPGKISNVDINQLAAFIRMTKWKVIYAVNFANSNPQTGADEAAAAAKALGDRLLGFEIGNEPDMYHKHGRKSYFYSYRNFVDDWKGFADAIVKRVPNAVFVGPSSATDAEGFTAPFAADMSDRIILLTEHYYRGDAKKPTSTLQSLLAPDPKLKSDLSIVSAAAKNNHIKGGFRLDEANSFFSGGVPGLSDGMGTALWAIDFLFENAKAGSTGVNFHSTGGARYSPIGTNTKGTITAIRPLYYGMVVFAMFAEGNLMDVSLSRSSPDFSAYALAGNDGSYRLILNNKSATQPATISFTFPSNRSPSYSTTMLTGPGLDSVFGVTLGGSPINVDGSWNYKRIITKISSSKVVQITVPPASAAFVRTN